MNRDGIIAKNPLPDYLRNRGFSLYPAGSNFVTNACPVELHRKFHRCVTIDTAKNLFHCNDCDKGGTVIDWEAIEKKITPAEAMQRLSGGSNGANPPATRPQIIATHDSRDEAGKLLFQICRFDPKNFIARRGPDDPQCKLGIIDVRRVLYRLPEVSKAQLVCIAEGEKNADDLAALGFVATTNPFGAGKWRDEYSETLRGKTVLIFGDVEIGTPAPPPFGAGKAASFCESKRTPNASSARMPLTITSKTPMKIRRLKNADRVEQFFFMYFQGHQMAEWLMLET